MGNQACHGSKVELVGGNSCNGEMACRARRLHVLPNSCQGNSACAGRNMDTAGLAAIGPYSCIGELSCSSSHLKVKGGGVQLGSCVGASACASREAIYVGTGACRGENACARTAGTQSNVGEVSYFLDGSCNCKNCCLCMTRVLAGKCNALGECCLESDPTQKANVTNDCAALTNITDCTTETPVQDFRLEELEQWLGVGTFDRINVFPPPDGSNTWPGNRK